MVKIFTDMNNPASFTSFEKVYNEAKKIDKKLSRSKARAQLETLRSYTLHKQRRIKFPRLKTVPNGLMTDMQADLADFQMVADQNDGYRYLLVCVDVLSRKVFTAPVYSKRPKDMITAFDIIFNSMVEPPMHLFTDKGLEFEANEVRNYFTRHGVLKYVAQSPDVKASIAERYIKTIKHRLSKYFSFKETNRWVDIMPLIVNGINNSVNRITGMKPDEVNKSNADELWNRLYLEPNKKIYRYKEGDHVRISKQKGDFEKGYLPNYTQEVFKINRVKSGRVPNYRLVDTHGEEILGKFYEHEFSKSIPETSDYYVVEEIIKERIRKGKKEYYVKWRGRKKKSWISREDLELKSI